MKMFLEKMSISVLIRQSAALALHWLPEGSEVAFRRTWLSSSHQEKIKKKWSEECFFKMYGTDGYVEWYVMVSGKLPACSVT